MYRRRLTRHAIPELPCPASRPQACKVAIARLLGSKDWKVAEVHRGLEVWLNAARTIKDVLAVDVETKNRLALREAT